MKDVLRTAALTALVFQSEISRTSNKGMKKMGKIGRANTMQSRVEVGMKVTLSPIPLSCSAALISGRKWWPPKAWWKTSVGAWWWWWWCSAGGVTRSYPPPPPPSSPPSSFSSSVEPTFQSGAPVRPPSSLSKRRFERNFSRASPSFFPLPPRWTKNRTIFWNFGTHFGEVPRLLRLGRGKIFSPMRVWIFTSISPARNILFQR